MSKSYVLFEEDNDWEGEVWAFFIPYEGNEDQLTKLENLIDGAGPYAVYLAKEDRYTKKEVKKHVRHATEGYLDSHNRVRGKLCKLPESVDWDSEDPFFKGGIRAFFYPADDE